METITITVPYSGEVKDFRVEPLPDEGAQTWRVLFDDGKEQVIGKKDDSTWQQIDGNNLDVDLITRFGKAIQELENNRAANGK